MGAVAGRPLDPSASASAVAVAAFAAALAAGPAIGSGPGPRGAGAALLIALLAVLLGTAAHRRLGLPVDTPWTRPAALILGYTALCLVHLIATAGLGVDVRGALAVDLAAAVGAAAIHRRDGGFQLWSAPGWRLDAGVVLGLAGLMAFWAREAIGAMASARATGIFPAWQDYLLHAAEVTYLRQYSAFDGTSLYLAGAPQPLYHRASYAGAALYSFLAGVPSLETATQFWLPAGLLVCGLGVYTFGTALAGRLGGFAAVVAVFLVPDASTYGLHNRFLSFHWLLQMAGGSGYALGLTLVALSALVVLGRTHRLQACVVAAALVAAAAPFRVHVAMLAGAMVAIFAVTAWRRLMTRTGLLAAVLAVIAGAGVLVGLESISLAPHFLTQPAHPIRFLVSVHSQASAMDTPFYAWTAGRGDVATFAIGYLMMLAAGCGIWCLALGTGYAARIVPALGWRAGAIVPCLLAAHLAVLLLVPAPAHGDITDFGHRPFVLVYVVAAVVSAAAGVLALGRWSTRRFGSSGPVAAVIAVLAVIGLAVPWRVGASIQQRWTAAYALLPMPSESIAAARLIAERAGPGDVVAAASADPLALYVALSERRAWLSRASLYAAEGSTERERFGPRAAALAALDVPVSLDELRALGRAHGVSWFIADTDATRAWSGAVRERCSFCGQTLQVYDLR